MQHVHLRLHAQLQGELHAQLRALLRDLRRQLTLQMPHLLQQRQPGRQQVRPGRILQHGFELLRLRASFGVLPSGVHLRALPSQLQLPPVRHDESPGVLDLRQRLLHQLELGLLQMQQQLPPVLQRGPLLSLRDRLHTSCQPDFCAVPYLPVPLPHLHRHR